MAAKALISVEEYLRTSFDGPDREYVDGEIVERNRGELQHSAIQARLIEIFYELRKRQPLFAMPELRHKVKPSVYRIPDVAVFAGEKPAESVPTKPPMIAIEIISPDDRINDVLKKLDEYRQWGVQHCWVVDPYLPKLFVYSDAGLMQVQAFELESHLVRIAAADIFTA
jgi:Uma2 family endonuclease